jgi:hypothetical protein
MTQRTKFAALLALILTFFVFFAISPASPGPISKNLGFFDQTAIYLCAALNGVLVSAITLACWATDKSGAGDKSLISIILSDFRITRFSVIGIITFLNSAIVGFLLGASAQLLLEGTATHLFFYHFLNLYGNDWKLFVEGIRQSAFGGSLILFVLVPVTRMTAEFNILVFRVAQKYLSE